MLVVLEVVIYRTIMNILMQNQDILLKNGIMRYIFNQQFDPPAGFWCGNQTEGGGAFTYTIPSGITYDNTILPNSYLYKNLINGVIQAWHPDYWAK